MTGRWKVRVTGGEPTYEYEEAFIDICAAMGFAVYDLCGEYAKLIDKKILNVPNTND